MKYKEIEDILNKPVYPSLWLLGKTEVKVIGLIYTYNQEVIIPLVKVFITNPKQYFYVSPESLEKYERNPKKDTRLITEILEQQERKYPKEHNHPNIFRRNLL